MEATPRRPAQETTPTWPSDVLKQARRADTAAGLPTKVIKIIMRREGTNTSGSWEGVTKSPRRKKIIIWATPVSTSKKRTRSLFSGM